MPARRLSLAFGAFCLLGAASTSCRHVPTPPKPTEASRFDYPTTRREDVVDVLHGVRVADPYRWLEGSGAKVTSSFEAQDKRARREIASLQGVDQLWAEIGALWKSIPNPRETRRGDRTFYRVSGTLRTRTRDGSEDVLFDPATQGVGIRLTDFDVSPDGLQVALELSKNGADMRTLRVLDVKRKTLLDEISGIEARTSCGLHVAFSTLSPPWTFHTRLGGARAAFDSMCPANPKRQIAWPSHLRMTRMLVMQ